MKKKRAAKKAEQPYKFTRVDGEIQRVHDLAMEKKLGRKLRPGEEVHHVDGDRRDNSLGNLELIKKSAHAKISDRKRDAKRRKKTHP